VVETWDVAVVGSLNMDLVVEAPRFPGPGETLMGGPFAMASGGKGLNQALAAARQGAVTRLIGTVGDDDHGQRLRAVASAAGIDIGGVAVTAGNASGIAVITVAPGGQNTIVVAPGANAVTNTTQVGSDPAVGSATVVLAQLEIPLTAVVSALTTARRAGHVTILNPAPARMLPDDVVGLCDLVVPNESEAALLTGCATDSDDGVIAAGRALLARGAGAVIITLGARGAMYIDRDRIEVVAPFAVDAIDATAAGDAFCGALAAALAQGSEVSGALRRASAAGALATTVAGAAPSLPTRAAVDELLAATR
jgi:ribokinase